MTSVSGTQFLLRGQDLRGFPILRILHHLADTEPPAFVTTTHSLCHQHTHRCQGDDVLVQCFSKNRNKGHGCLFKAVVCGILSTSIVLLILITALRGVLPQLERSGPEWLSNRFKVTKLGSG